MGKGINCYNGSDGRSSQLLERSVVKSFQPENNLSVNFKVKQNIRKLLAEHPDGLLLSKFPQKYQEQFSTPFSSHEYGFHSLKELVLALPDVFRHEKHKLSNEWLLFDAREVLQKSSGDNDKWIPNNILENMKKLVHKHPNGIYGNKVLELYEAKFNSSLDIKAFGFESVGSFLVFCQSVDCKQEGDELVVFPKQKKAEEVEDFPPAIPSPNEMSHIWSKYYSDDVCNRWFRYEPFQLPPGPITYLKVVVCDVKNPHNIWLQLLNRVQELNNMMNELNIFYYEEEGHYMMDPNTVVDNHACAVQFTEDNKWHRATITKSVSLSEVHVFYIDYGTEQIVSYKNLRYLHKKFSVLPIQVIKGEMADLIWSEEHDCWPRSTNCYTVDLMLDKSLVAEVIRIHFNEPKLEIVLYDTSTSQDICLNDMILRNGYAVRSNFVQSSDSSETDTDVEEAGKNEETDTDESSSDEEEIYDENLANQSSMSDSFDDNITEQMENIVTSITNPTSHLDSIKTIPMMSTPSTNMLHNNQNVMDSLTVTDNSFTAETFQSNLEPNHLSCLQETRYQHSDIGLHGGHPGRNPRMVRPPPGFHAPIQPNLHTQLASHQSPNRLGHPPSRGLEVAAADCFHTFSGQLQQLTRQVASIKAELSNLRISPEPLLQQDLPLDKPEAMPSLMASSPDVQHATPIGWGVDRSQTPWAPSPINENQQYRALFQRNPLVAFQQGLPGNDSAYWQGCRTMNTSPSIPSTAYQNVAPMYSNNVLNNEKLEAIQTMNGNDRFKNLTDPSLCTSLHVNQGLKTLPVDQVNEETHNWYQGFSSKTEHLLLTENKGEDQRNDPMYLTERATETLKGNSNTQQSSDIKSGGLKNTLVSKGLDFIPCKEALAEMEPDETSDNGNAPFQRHLVSAPAYRQNCSGTIQRIKTVVVFNRFLHVIRKEQSLYVPLEELVRTYTPFTTMVVVIHRLQTLTNKIKVVQLNSNDYPKLFAELRRTEIFGIKMFPSYILLIPVQRTRQFLMSMVPNDPAMFAAFKKFQSWEQESLHTFYDIMKD